jgi:hypothetical protein
MTSYGNGPEEQFSILLDVCTMVQKDLSVGNPYYCT